MKSFKIETPIGTSDTGTCDRVGKAVHKCAAVGNLGISYEGDEVLDGAVQYGKQEDWDRGEGHVVERSSHTVH